MPEPAPTRATILIIGDELLAGEIPDKNGPFLAEQLTSHGARVVQVRILPDTTEIIARAVTEGLADSSLVVVCGGLGPTTDDRTTEAVALALGRELVSDAESWERIRLVFSFRNIEPPPGNEKQALIPQGAEILTNNHGTAPGYLARTPGCHVAVLPGPPRENRPMFTDQLLPHLATLNPGGPKLVTRVFRVFGLPESGVGDRLRDFEEEFPRVRLGYQARFPEILLKLRYDTPHTDEADRGAAALHEALDPHLYTEGETLLPEILGRALAERGLRIVTAESCTGGLIAKLLTDVSGSSAWMDRGYVTYTNQSKIDNLGVPATLLEAHGAVSEPVAEAMLRGALERSQAQVGVAVTGIAGPTGGTPDKPVGTICFAWGDPDRLETRTTRFPFDRSLNRTLTAWAALSRLQRWLGTD